MASKRRWILALAVVSMASTAGLGSLAAAVGGEATTLEPAVAAPPSTPTALDPDRARTGAQSSSGDAGLLPLIFLISAIASALVFAVSMGFLRKEIRMEKRKQRDRKARQALAKDLREFRRSREGGYDGENT